MYDVECDDVVRLLIMCFVLLAVQHLHSLLYIKKADSVSEMIKLELGSTSGTYSQCAVRPSLASVLATTAALSSVQKIQVSHHHHLSCLWSYHPQNESRSCAHLSARSTVMSLPFVSNSPRCMPTLAAISKYKPIKIYTHATMQTNATLGRTMHRSLSRKAALLRRGVR